MGEKYKPNTIREVATKFSISTSRLMDLRRGAAINREDTQRSKMLKAKKKEETEGKTPTGSRATSPEEPATPQGVKQSSNKQNSRSFSGPPNIPKVNRLKS